MGTNQPNYTEQDTHELIELYSELGNDGLEEIAEKMEKTIPSIRAKLVREGVYIPPKKALGKRAAEGPSKKELLNELESLVGFQCNGFMNATKGALRELIAHLKDKS